MPGPDVKGGGSSATSWQCCGAEKELRRASKLGVADGAVLPLLARALLAQGKLEELQALTPGKPDGQGPKGAKYWLPRGLGNWRRGKWMRPRS